MWFVEVLSREGEISKWVRAWVQREARVWSELETSFGLILPAALQRRSRLEAGGLAFQCSCKVSISYGLP